MIKPDVPIEVARETVLFAIRTGLVKRAHITGFRSGMELIAPDVFESVFSPDVFWAVEQIVDQTKAEAEEIEKSPVDVEPAGMLFAYIYCDEQQIGKGLVSRVPPYTSISNPLEYRMRISRIHFFKSKGAVDMILSASGESSREVVIAVPSTRTRYVGRVEHTMGVTDGDENFVAHSMTVNLDWRKTIQYTGPLTNFPAP